MPPPTNIWDVTFPPDTQAANLLGQDLRNFRLDTQQRMANISGTLANRWDPSTDAQAANWTGLLYFATDTNQIFQWSGAAWVQISFAGNFVIPPLNLTGQLVAIAPTTLYAVPVAGAGIYRVTSDLIITTVGTGGTISYVITWNNGSSTPSQTSNALSVLALGESNVSINTFAFYSAASQNITYTILFTGVTGTPQYSFRSRIEFLG